jgi:hypothetical protein
MAKVIKGGLVTSVVGTGADGREVELAMLRSEFHAADYSPGTCPPKLVEVRKALRWSSKMPQSVACFVELGRNPGETRFFEVAVMEKPSEIVDAMTKAGFNAPPVISVATQVRRLLLG